MRLGALLLVMLAGGCTLLPRSAPAEVHYYTPETLASSRPPAPVADAGSPTRLRLGRTTASAYLRSRIAYRETGYEVGSYVDRRWTEDPDAYLRRALTRALFEERGIGQVVSGPAPILDVELVSFEEVRRAEARAGRVELAYVLHEEGIVLSSGRSAVEIAASASDMGSVIAAIARALNEVAAKTADDVVARVTRSRPGLPP